MHELGIANSILDAVRAELARYPGKCAAKVGVRIGELAAVDPESLQFCFGAIVADTDLSTLKLEVEFCPRQHQCKACGRTFKVCDYDVQCPACASLQTECCSGDELELGYLEVEDCATSLVGKESTQ